MKKEDIPFLKQMIKSLDESAAKLDAYYEKKDFGNFVETKKFIAKIQKEILEKAT